MLPPVLAHRPDYNVWESLGEIHRLMQTAGGLLPPVTWLIRSDETVRFCTGDFASGYLCQQSLWRRLVSMGHELGWHMHLASFSDKQKRFDFDPEPAWLPEANRALTRHFPVTATRTGWDYGSTWLVKELDDLGVLIDFSALPGNIAWFKVGRTAAVCDWRRCCRHPYHPNLTDYQRPGSEGLTLLEVPVAQFRNTLAGCVKRLARRAWKGSYSMAGLRSKTILLTEPWRDLPNPQNAVWAFYFHPYDLAKAGLRNFIRNLEHLHSLPNIEFVTATALARSMEPAFGLGARTGRADASAPPYSLDNQCAGD